MELDVLFFPLVFLIATALWIAPIVLIWRSSVTGPIEKKAWLAACIIGGWLVALAFVFVAPLDPERR
jgi:cytochrome bd-type quinol oxidase subunit 2